MITDTSFILREETTRSSTCRSSGIISQPSHALCPTDLSLSKDVDFRLIVTRIWGASGVVQEVYCDTVLLERCGVQGSQQTKSSFGLDSHAPSRGQVKTTEDFVRKTLGPRRLFLIDDCRGRSVESAPLPNKPGYADDDTDGPDESLHTTGS